jgi:hypothetical protein
MIGYIIIIIIIGIIVSIITEQMLIRRLRLEEGVTISKGKCLLKPGYGLIPEPTTIPSGTNNVNQENQIHVDGKDFSGIGRNNLTDNNLNKFYKSLK